MAADTYLVLGGGPAGLFAAWACVKAGFKAHILAEKIAKPTPESAGVFVLHDDMGLPLRQRRMVCCSMGGDSCDYAQKVYGDRTMPNSFPSGGSTIIHPRWRPDIYDAHQALDMVWDILAHGLPGDTACTMEAASIGNWDAVRAMSEGQGFRGTISTIPLDVFQPDLPWVPAWVTTSAAPADECYMLYNANKHMPWYRASAAFGRFTMEYVKDPGIAGVRRVRKVMLAYGCDLGILLADPKRYLFTGRFGAWDKAKLSHHAYTDTMDWIRSQ